MREQRDLSPRGLCPIVLLIAASCGPTSPRSETPPPAPSAIEDAAVARVEPPTAEEPGATPAVSRPQTKRPSVVETFSLGTATPIVADGDGPACLDRVRRAYGHIKSGALARSEPLLKQAIEECPGYAAAHYNLAVIRGMRGDFDAAGEAIGAALAANFLRYDRFMRDDPELEPLRRSKAWPEVEARAEELRAAWIEALGEPGVFLILGHDDPRASLVFDDMGDLLRVVVPASVIGRFRGQLVYLHLATGRLLPLSRTREVGGMLVDRQRREVHVVEWDRLKVTQGFNYDAYQFAIEYSVDSGRLKGLRISTIDLETMTSSPPAEIPGETSSRKLARCGDRLILGPDRLSGGPTWSVAQGELTPIDGDPPDLDGCDEILRVIGPHAWELMVTQECHLLDLTGADAPEQVCRLRDELYEPSRRVVLRRPDGDQVLLQGPQVVQLEGSGITPPEPPPVAPARAPSCETIDSIERVGVAKLTGYRCETRDVAVQGDYAFVASDWCGVMIWDISAPRSPRRVASLYTGGTAHAVHIDGRHLFVGDGQGLRAVDVSNPVAARGYPGSPKLLGLGNTGPLFFGWDLEVRGKVAYVASRGEGLHVFDLSDPAAPRHVTKVKGTANAVQIAFEDPEGQALRLRSDILYRRVRATERVIDLSDPLAPRAGEARSARPMPPRAFAGPYKLVATKRGLEVFDRRDPGARALASVALGGLPRDVEVQGRYAYVASSPTWLHIVELCDESSGEPEPAER